VGTFEPEAAEAWLVPVPARIDEEPTEPEHVPLVLDDDEALVRARVVDLDGGPIEGCRLRFIPEDASLLLEPAESDASGRVELRLDPGRYRLSVASLGARLGPRRLTLSPGANDLGDLVLPMHSARAYLAVTVVGPGEEFDPYGLVLLVELATGREFAWDSRSDYGGGVQEADGVAEFRIEGLMPGPYRVSFLASDGLEYAPRALEVLAPAEGLTFRASSSEGREYRFEVHRPDGSLAPEYQVHANLRGCWLMAGDEDDEEFPAAYEEWIVLAPGCRPRRGTFSAPVPIVDHDWRGFACGLIRVDLEPGYGAALVCLDVEGEGLLEFLGTEGGSPLAGVDWIADGELRATSDAHGLLLLDTASPPERYELNKPGWRLLEQYERAGMPQVLFARQSP
jgi:hypothetical protein